MNVPQAAVVGALVLVIAGCSSTASGPRIGTSKSSDGYDPAYQLTTESVAGRVDCVGDILLQGYRGNNGNGYQKIDVWACEEGKAVHREYWFTANMLDRAAERAAAEYDENSGLTAIRRQTFIRNGEGEFVIEGGRGAIASAEQKQTLEDTAKGYIARLRAQPGSGSPTPTSR